MFTLGFWRKESVNGNRRSRFSLGVSPAEEQSKVFRIRSWDFVFKNLVALFFTKTKNCVSDATILILESAVSPLGPSGYWYCVNSTAAFQWAILKV